MTGKRYEWHKSWSIDRDGCLCHTSGLRLLITRGDGYVDLVTDDASLAIFQASETSRGVPMHQLTERVKRLVKEAQMYWDAVHASLAADEDDPA